MIQLEGQSLEQLDEASEDLAKVIDRELTHAMTEVVSGLGDQIVVAAPVDTVAPDDLNRFLTRWQQVVDDVLMGAVTAQYEAASLDELNKLTAALGGVLSPAQLATITAQVSGQVMSEASLATARNRLVGLGEEVWLAARDELVTGLQQGESIADMVNRITSATDEIGETRAETIARTETIGVRNEASLDVVDGLQVTALKTWQATLDDRTRPSHVDADGQTVPKEEPFDVGGASLMHPADGRGPAEEVINCRCTMTFSFDEDELMNLLDPDNPINQPLAAAANPHIHNGAMIALVPTEEDAQRLAIEDMEPVEELHLTLQFLGDAGELPAEAAKTIAAELETISGQRGPITGNAFAVDWFNPAGDEPAWVLGVGGEELSEMHLAAIAAASAPDPAVWTSPEQHQPWVAHVTLAYSAEPSLAESLAERVGDITFDRLRLAVGTEVTDFPLTNDGGDTMQAAAVKGAAMPKTAQTEEIEVGAEEDAPILSGVAMVEGQPTGDGRMWAEGAVTWPDPATTRIPLQWQKETTHGGMNDVTVSVGRLTKLERVGAEIRFEALVDTGSEDGAEVWRRYSARTGEDDLGFIGGVSIVGDDPDDPFGADVELIWPEGCDMNDPEGDPMEMMFNEACAAPEMVVFHSTRIRALTLVDTPAFVEAAAQSQGPLTASAYTIEIPDRPPLEWFREPTEAPEIGTITVTESGRFYGYVAPKNVAHRGYQDKVVTVPMGNVDYSTWMNRPTILDSGERIATGAITMDCGHASSMAWVGAQHSRDHYDNSCSVVATARVGENAYGVWIAGALLPGVTGHQVARMMACQLSGDWRPHRTKAGKREFTAALVVPVPALTAPSMKIEDHVLVAAAVPVRMDPAALVASVIGSTDLPVAPRDTEWDGQAALERVFDLCTDGETVDVDCVSRAFLWRDPDQDADNRGAYSLGFADVVDGQLRIVPAGVAAAAGGRGVDAADIPAADKDRIKSRICSLYDRIQSEFDDWPDCPFEDASASMEASSRAHRVYADHLMASVGLDLESRAKRVMEGVSK